jgi:hypothetical protein
MSKLIAVVGESGSGKSTSIRTLDPKETYIINVAGKELPFKGSAKLYNTEKRNYKEVSDAKEILALARTISNEAKHVKTIIIEDSNYIMAFNLLDKALETGYTKFSLLGKNMVNLIQELKKLRDDLNIYYFTHYETVEDGGEIVSYKIKTSGKLLDSQVVMEGLFTVVLYTFVESKGEKTSYNFVTNRYNKIPAKSPMGMFDEVKIPNDLSIVNKAVTEYYN